MTDDHAGWGEPQEYTDVFLRSAHQAVLDLCDRRGGEFESLTGEAVSDAADNVGVAATAVVLFRGRRYVFRRGIWPPSHPATTQAAIYATVLEERLLTRVHPRLGDDVSPVHL
ncbi:hypothetical protein QQM39_20070 [Streptomyces sp. DT2A-34]|uniref:hypothetical protein n=1 Tax=Streptomyces sp. DT2A-34 TaxID=3051182 RepID=UPI00265BA2D4|nr:hypothetical protein [Streptomyces sp. DT2A-34]MDO0913064.1 hypothetical protein [Streptomyces sp. DT2A-34]